MSAPLKKFVSKVKSKDQFGETYHMRIDANAVALNSWMGSLFSLILLGVMIIFTYLKADVLIQKKDVDVLSTVNDRHFTPEDKINYE